MAHHLLLPPLPKTRASSRLAQHHTHTWPCGSVQPLRPGRWASSPEELAASLGPGSTRRTQSLVDGQQGLLALRGGPEPLGLMLGTPLQGPGPAENWAESGSTGWPQPSSAGPSLASSQGPAAARPRAQGSCFQGSQGASRGAPGRAPPAWPSRPHQDALPGGKVPPGQGVPPVTLEVESRHAGGWAGTALGWCDCSLGTLAPLVGAWRSCSPRHLSLVSLSAWTQCWPWQLPQPCPALPSGQPAPTKAKSRALEREKAGEQPGRPVPRALSRVPRA